MLLQKLCHRFSQHSLLPLNTNTDTRLANQGQIMLLKPWLYTIQIIGYGSLTHLKQCTIMQELLDLVTSQQLEYQEVLPFFLIEILYLLGIQFLTKRLLILTRAFHTNAHACLRYHVDMIFL